jgi:hypothetical protein
VNLEATPPLDPALAKALVALLEDLDARSPAHDGDDSAWRRAALAEAISDSDDAVDYALSPRSTRGATRA